MSAVTAKEPATGREPAVLVIDPNEEHQVLSTVALGRRGFRVTVASSALEGIRLALSQNFSAIVIDLKLRDMPALEVLSRLRQRIPDVPKILVVAVGQEQSAVRALDSGASGYLVKTARYNELLPSEVEAQIGAARARRNLRAQDKALGESEERFRKAFRASPVAFAIVSRKDGTIVDANDALLGLLRYSREELVGRPLPETVLRGDPQAAARIREGIAEKGSLRELEVPILTKAGESRIGLASVESIEIEGQGCLLTILRDVTEERRAERLRLALYEISEATSTARDLPDLFRQIHGSVARLMPAENFYIALHDPVTDFLSFPYFVDEKEPTPEPYKAGRGLTEYVLRTGSPLLVTPSSFEDMVAQGAVESVGATGVDWLGVPLSVAGRVFGVLAVQSYAETTRYTQAEEQMLSMVSAQVALAIDRKRSEEAREADRRRFEAILAKMSDGVSLVGEDGLVNWQSPSAARMFGYTPGESIGKSGLGFLHPDDLADAGPGFAVLMSTPGKSLVAEVRVRHKDGSWRWTEVMGTNLLEDPDLRSIVFNYRDITERNEALEQIRFQASLLSHVRNGVIATDAGFRIIYWNDYATTTFGWRASEVRGRYLGDVLTFPGARMDFEAVTKSILETGHWEGERMMARKDGTRFLAGATLTALRDSNGAVIGFVGVTADLTERLLAQKQLEARAKQQAAVAALGQKALAEPSLSIVMNEALSTLTQTLSVESAAVLELSRDGVSFGIRAKVGWDLPLGTRIPNAPDRSLAAYTLSTGGPVILENSATETRFKPPPYFIERGLTSGISVVIPGSKGPYGILGAQSRNPRAFSEDDLHFVTSVANVIATAIERNGMEKALAENERLASMGQLAAYVAHEINTPLTNISLLAANIARRERNPEILRKLAAIGEERRKATAIVTDLVEFPRQAALRRVPEDIRKVIHAAVEQVEPYRKPDVSLVVELHDRAVFAKIDTVQIRDVFVNLLRNALQATSRGTVAVRLAELPGFLFVSVQDTGTGMAPELLQQLFHPLYGLGARADGSPFGLATSRSIVAAHGGKIEATSELGKGSTFTVILPRFEDR